MQHKMDIKWFPTIEETCSKMGKNYSNLSQVEGELR